MGTQKRAENQPNARKESPTSIAYEVGRILSARQRKLKKYVLQKWPSSATLQLWEEKPRVSFGKVMYASSLVLFLDRLLDPQRLFKKQLFRRFIWLIKNSWNLCWFWAKATVPNDLKSLVVIVPELFKSELTQKNVPFDHVDLNTRNYRLPLFAPILLLCEPSVGHRDVVHLFKCHSSWAVWSMDSLSPWLLSSFAKK